MRRLFSILVLVAAAVAQQGYTGNSNASAYVPLPGCSSTTPSTCSSINVPNSNTGSGTVAVTAANIGTVGGYLNGVGTIMSGYDDASYGTHKLIRFTDASLNTNNEWHAGQANSPNANSNSTLFEVCSDGGNCWIEGFNPSTLAVSPFTSALKYSFPMPFDPVNPLKVYLFASVNTGTFVATQGVQAAALTLSVNGSGTPSIASATQIFDLTSGTHCLSSAANSYIWNGTFKPDGSASSFGVALSLSGGQDKGYIFAVYTIGKGCRVWYTDSRLVTGDWGPCSCGDCTAHCFDGTVYHTNANYIAQDWLTSTVFAANAKIAPYINNTHNCVFTTVSGGTSGSSASGPNWDSLDGGSCTFGGSITDNTITWVLSSTNGGNGVGVNGGLCGANGSYNSGQYGACTPISETDTFPIHDATQLKQAAYVSVSPGGCFQNNGYCQSTDVGNYIWPVGTMTAQSCLESHIAAQADWTPGATVNSSGINGVPTAGGGPLVVIFPRNGSGRSGNGNQFGGGVYPYNFLLYKMTTPGTESLTEPTWTAGVVIDGTVHWTSFATAASGGTCSGHEGQGYSHIFKGTNYQSASPLNNFGNYLNQFQLSAVLNSDQHTSQFNTNVSDANPVAFFTTQVDTSATGLFLNSSSNPNCAGGNCSMWNELFLLFPSYSAGNTANELRVGHTFNSGSNLNFAEQNALGEISPDGNWLYFTSDMEGTLGSTAGTANCVINSTCRNDVFLLQIRPNGYVIPAPSPTFAFNGPFSLTTGKRRIRCQGGDGTLTTPLQANLGGTFRGHQCK